jgi:phospholipase/carboxylesterase
VEPTGRPRVFISHGRQDQVLPIERCGRRLARVLTGSGYAVEYRELDGGHDVPPDVVRAALEWLSDQPTGG